MEAARLGGPTREAESGHDDQYALLPLPTELPPRARISLSDWNDSLGSLDSPVESPIREVGQIPAATTQSFQDLEVPGSGDRGHLSSLLISPYRGADELPSVQGPSFQDLEPAAVRTVDVPVDPALRMKVFNATAGHILAAAYQRFPEMVSVIPTVEGPKAGVDANFYRDSLKWLEAESFIRTDRFSKDLAASIGVEEWGFTLTGKGLGVLTTMPKNLRTKEESLGDAMVGAAKKGALESLQSLAKEALSYGATVLSRVALDHISR